MQEAGKVEWHNYADNCKGVIGGLQPARRSKRNQL